MKNWLKNKLFLNAFANPEKTFVYLFVLDLLVFFVITIISMGNHFLDAKRIPSVFFTATCLLFPVVIIMYLIRWLFITTSKPDENNMLIEFAKDGQIEHLSETETWGKIDNVFIFKIKNLPKIKNGKFIYEYKIPLNKEGGMEISALFTIITKKEFEKSDWEYFLHFLKEKRTRDLDYLFYEMTKEKLLMEMPNIEPEIAKFRQEIIGSRELLERIQNKFNKVIQDCPIMLTANAIEKMWVDLTIVHPSFMGFIKGR